MNFYKSLWQIYELFFNGKHKMSVIFAFLYQSAYLTLISSGLGIDYSAKNIMYIKRVSYISKCQLIFVRILRRNRKP